MGLHGFRGFIFWVMDFGSRILWGISRIARIYFLDHGFYGDYTDCADLFFGSRILWGFRGLRGF